MNHRSLGNVGVGRGMWFLVCGLILAGWTVGAAVRLPGMFSNHMVLQRDRAVPVWGWAAAGETVTVRFGAQSAVATAGDDGKWRVNLAPLPASQEPGELRVVGENEIVLSDVLVGDVWVCSGQSNMEWRLSNALEAGKEIAAADYPLIRQVVIPKNNQAGPVEDVKSSWVVCSPETAGGFTAVGYFFGRRLHLDGGVPVGLISSSWGGTRIEPWTAPVGFQAVPELSGIAERVATWDVSTAAGQAVYGAYIQAVEQWAVEAQAALAAKKYLPGLPVAPVPESHQEPTKLYNGMIHPLLPYAICGAIWYQGESNGGEGESYFHKTQALIGGWREVWGQGDFPFYFVQLANFQQPTQNPAGGDGWAKLREAQRKSLTIPKTGMAVIIDIGESNDIHPRNKQDVGERLARWALADVYGKEIVVSGPLYKSHQVDGNKIRIAFEHVGSGLMVGAKSGLAPTTQVADGELKWFAIAGADQAWHWAEAQIDGATVVVSSPQVAEPVAVRYAYAMNPEGANLYNQEGLPASPFRTDDW